MKKYKHADNIVWEMIEGSILIMNANNFKTFLIEDRIGKLIWNELNEPTSLKDIDLVIKKNFTGYDKQGLNEVIAFIDELIRNQIISEIELGV